MLKVLNIPKVYRLEAQPFLFSENVNRLVHVSGYVGSVVEVEDPNIPSFVVDTVTELAPNCSAKISSAAIRQALVKARALTSSGDAATIGMTDMAFTPTKVIVKVGQTVLWKNSSSVLHNVVDDASRAVNRSDIQLPPGAKQFDSGYLQPGQTFSHEFTIPGTYRYVCTLHETSGMKAVVIVK